MIMNLQGVNFLLMKRRMAPRTMKTDIAAQARPSIGVYPKSSTVV